MDLELMTRNNYFIKRNPQIEAYEIMRASRGGETVPVQTNISTMAKAVTACEEWREREMHASMNELIGAVETMMMVELERQRKENDDAPEVNTRLMAAAAIMGMQIYIDRNKPAAKSS